ncbi:MAG: hypothetical protein RIC35_10720 [Marinoscillum sp.]
MKNILKHIDVKAVFPLFVAVAILVSCSKSDPTPGDGREDPTDTLDQGNDSLGIVNLFPDQTHQEIIGFGGALSWWCDRITKSSKKAEIIDAIVNDLGLDVLRLKNWYYPVSYPANKTPNAMETDWFIYHYDATNELYDLIKTANPDVKVLFSSWGPPSYLKSNNKLDRGTLKKTDGQFMYDEYATYWEDVLNNITFMPDYLSIQNEPTWLADWETCEWAPAETATLPSYEIALDKVAEKLTGLANPPILVIPESANLSHGGFDAFAEKLRDNPNAGIYGYHPYNFNDNSAVPEFQATLKALGEQFDDKPKMMTEYSGMGWMKTAQFINSTLREANTAAYIYWQLMWADDADEAMITMDANGNYKLTKFFYLMKHYAKYIDQGYRRIDLTADETSVDQVGFISPDQKEITLISINPTSREIEILFQVKKETITQIDSYQSIEDDHFTHIETTVGKKLTLEASSVTTTVLKLQ